MNQILIVEDEKAISDLIRINLESEGFACTCAYDGIAAIDILEEHTFDLILLDIMLSGADGYEILDYIKPSKIPAIFITAKAQSNDIVKGLDMGAEDYIVKPFEITELLARINVVLRRFNKTDTHLKYHNIDIDTEQTLVLVNNSPVELTPKEYELLVMLVRNVNIILFRDKIYEQIWGTYFDGNTRTLDLHINRLRQKLELKNELTTIYKVGYRLEK